MGTILPQTLLEAVIDNPVGTIDVLDGYPDYSSRQSLLKRVLADLPRLALTVALGGSW